MTELPNNFFSQSSHVSCSTRSSQSSLPGGPQGVHAENDGLFFLWQTSSSAPDDLALSGVAPELPRLKGRFHLPAHGARSIIKLLSLDRQKELAGHDAAAYVEEFKECCRQKYTTLVRCWRMLLDPACSGRVSFVPFCSAARSMGFSHISTLWKQLDFEHSGFITLENWDPSCYHTIMKFRGACLNRYSSLPEAFQCGMDKVGCGMCPKKDFKKYLEEIDFHGHKSALWAALDVKQDGYITVAELDILKCQGEHFHSEVEHRDHCFRHRHCREPCSEVSRLSLRAS